MMPRDDSGSSEHPGPQVVHRVRVFVFGYREQRPDYLLVRRDPSLESFWTPLHGPLGFGEKLESAVRREARDDAGLDRLGELIDLKMPATYLFGSEQIVEWNFAARANEISDALELNPDWSDFRWAEFTEAFPALEFEQDRAAILRLHTLLLAA
jgi:ADP-ribose pyrophosphatase YjhB (NUDIX family)